MWLSVAATPALNFLVVQNYNLITFYDRSIPGFEAGRKSFVIDINAYARPGASNVGSTPCRFASGKGYLFIVNQDIEPLIVNYDKAIDLIGVNPIKILARDFEGLQDNLQNDEEPYELSKEHHYNLQNQGWLGNRMSVSSGAASTNLNGYTYNLEVTSYDVDTYQQTTAYQETTGDSPIFKFKQVLGRFPGNNKQWWVARQEADDPDTGAKTGDFLPRILDTLYSGNNRAPRGHYILNQFRKDRSTVSGISDIPIVDLGERPNAIAFFSGRAWYAAASTIFYSQILDTTSASKAGLCYQEADPTAEDISDLIASDGGVVPIPEADHIEAIKPMANGVMVFANNGVWFVSGGSDAFSALNIAVTKVSPIGTKSPLSIVETDGTIFWWSEIGIQALQQANGQFGPIPNRFGNTNICEATIQSYYNEIGATAKHLVKGLHDPRNNLLIWLFNRGNSNDYEYDSALFYDITLQAFYPWQMSEIPNGPRITGLFLDSGLVESTTEEQLFDDGVPITDDGDPVEGIVKDVAIKPSAVYYLTQVPGEGLTVSAPINNEYVDWEQFDGEGLTYDSFILTGYELNNDAMRDKQIVYLFAHFRRTEDDQGENQSSCKLVARWDWAGERNTRKWSSEIEAYRPRSIHLTDVVVTKNKVRGNGKSVQFRFGTNERGKTFDLLGWSVGYSGVTQP
jgi:hypothetical protein